MKQYQVAEDLQQWQSLLDWLELPPLRATPPGPFPAPLTAGNNS
jgi:hypothetical protein